MTLLPSPTRQQTLARLRTLTDADRAAAISRAIDAVRAATEHKQRCELELRRLLQEEE